MTSPQPTRRRLLLGLSGLIGLGATGVVWGRFGGGPAQPSTTTATVVNQAPPTTSDPPPTRPAAVPETASAETTTTTTVPLVVRVRCREAWDARPPGKGMEPHTIDRLTVHHTAAPISDPADAPTHLRGHQAFHQGDRGWPDIAYHYLIGPDGTVFEGRDPAFRGDTATDYEPGGHLLVCVDGDFDRDEPNDAQLAALVDMLALGAATYQVDPSTIGGHRDFAATSCPGDLLYPVVEDGTLERRVRERLAEATPVLELVCE